tara:strand:+ start:674 stop:1951 length:1278 start_codon:yes stop_codon:yes gene_type:complete
MSGTVTNNIFGVSGLVVAAAGGLEWQPVVTASTVTVSSGKGYWINTTSNACTITLPSSAEVGDQIIFGDYARTWATNAITIDSNGLNFQGSPDTYTVDYDTNGQAINIVYSGATKGWTPVSDITTALEPVAPETQRAIFAFGEAGLFNGSNLVNSSGVVGSDVAAVPSTGSKDKGATNYGGDKAIFAFGEFASGVGVSAISNLVSNQGVIASDTAGVGTSRAGPSASTYGSDGQAIFGYGSGVTAVTNLVSNQGVIASDTSGVGTARTNLAAVPFGGDKGIFAYGYNGSMLSVSNKISNSGVVASDVSGVGTARYTLSASKYGVGKGIFGYGLNAGGAGNPLSMTNLVSDSGVIASDVSGVGTARGRLGGAGYGGDKGIFGFGSPSSGYTAITNKINNLGVVAADTSGVGTPRNYISAAAYGYST